MEKIPSEKIEQELEGAVVVGQIIEQDEQRKHKVIEIYNEIKLLLESIIGDNVEKELTTEFGDIVDEIEKHQEELKRVDCPIVVAGETSAGKSSLINLILGRDILPQQLLSCTTTICRLRNKDKIAISVINEKDETEEIDISTTADESIVRQRLKKYVSRQSDNKKYKYVDISLPIPFLKSHTLIVDTPGIGSSEGLTHRLLDYLPNAIAFIYVINSSNAGGIQTDRLLTIFEKQKDSKLHEFDPKIAIFVCNKWDQIPPEDEAEVWEFICKELNKNWPNLNPEEQIYKLSVRKEMKKQRQGLKFTENFSKLLSGIEKLIPASLEAKVARHTRWQNIIMEKMHKRIVSKIRYSKQTKEEIDKEKTQTEDIVKHLKPSLKQIKSEIIEEANMKCADIAKRLHTHLNDPSTTDRLFRFAIHELPTGRYDWFIKEKATTLILDRINAEIRVWCITQRVDVITEDLYELLRQRYQKVESEIENICNILNDCKISFEKTYSKKDKTLRDRGFLDACKKIVFLEPFFSFFPLSFTITALMSPLLLTLVFKDVFDKMGNKDYNANKQEFMRRWCFQSLKEFNAKNIEKLLHDSYLNDFKKRVTHLLDLEIPNRIEADKKSIDNIIKDIRTSSIIREHYCQMENRCMVILGKIVLVEMEFFSGCKIPEDKIRSNTDKFINNGTHADVFETNICISDQWTKAAMKCLRRPLDDDDIYIQLTEVQTLRRLRHPNIVELYGMSYKIDCDGKKYLKIFMEYCSESLEKLVMSKKRHWEPCHKFSSCDKCGRFLEFYIKMMCDVCQGLSYIHKEGFVHRDLKLSNILVKDRTAKIADVGIAKEVQPISGTLTGTPSMMAPEVLSKRLYGTEADIYSVGIVLWEMWYCRPSYTKITDSASGNFAYAWQYVSDLHDYVREGHRPDFDFGYSPPKDLKSLIEKCWDSEINNRPTAEQVLNELNNLKK